MKKSVIITLILASLLFTAWNSLGHAADYVSSTFPPDRLLKELINSLDEFSQNPEEYIIMGKVKDGTEKNAYIVYAHHVNHPTEPQKILLKKTDKNFWYYEINVPGDSQKGSLQTSY
jgi:hypothetical protein